LSFFVRRFSGEVKVGKVVSAREMEC